MQLCWRVAGFLTIALLSISCHGVERLVIGPSVDHEHPADLTQVWHTRVTANGGSSWFGQPALDNGTVFFQAGDTVVALDASAGTVKWKRSVAEPLTTIGEAVLARDGRIFVSEGDSAIALTTAGQPLWSFHPDLDASLVFPGVDDRAFYTGQREVPVVYAIAVADGHLLWRKNIGPDWPFFGFVEGLAASGDTLYVSAEKQYTQNGFLRAGVVVALSRLDGNELWRIEMPDQQSGFRFAPVVSGRLLVLSDLIGGRTVAIERFDKRIAWTLPHHANSTPVVVGDSVFGASNDTFAWAARLSTGALIWQKATGGSNFAAAYCAGALFVNQDMVQRLEAHDGAYTGAFNFSNERIYLSAFVADGTKVYFSGLDGIYAVKCR